MSGLFLWNARTHEAIASEVEVAATRAARRRGLLGRNALNPSAALILTPCCSIHTAFMRFPIDVIFVDREWRALRIIWGLAPWRAAIVSRASAVVELAAGSLRMRDIVVGDRIFLALEIGAGVPAASLAGIARS